MFIKELVETDHYSNLFTKGSVKLHNRGLTTNNLIEKIPNCSLSSQKQIKKGTNDLLKKQPVGKVLVSPNFVQMNDI
jgi:hypothetical protein